MNEPTPTAADSDDETTTTDDAVPTESLSDPESLREDVPFVEETSVHDDEDHCSVGIDGRAVVGVTNDDGEVLLAVHEESSIAMLPHGPVEPGDDWATVGRRAVEEMTGVTVELVGPELVRNFDHFVEGNDERHTTSYNVVFRASPAGDETSTGDPGVVGNDDWDAGWFDEFPGDLMDVGGPVEDDVRLFLD
jgi:ADP-ribose pyrophosphatase YjhB (NUDIX family)